MDTKSNLFRSASLAVLIAVGRILYVKMNKQDLVAEEIPINEDELDEELI